MIDSQPNLRSESERSKSSRLHSHKQLWVIATINFLVLGIIIFALVGSRQQELDKAANTF